MEYVRGQSDHRRGRRSRRDRAIHVFEDENGDEVVDLSASPTVSPALFPAHRAADEFEVDDDDDLVTAAASIHDISGRNNNSGDSGDSRFEFDPPAVASFHQQLRGRAVNNNRSLHNISNPADEIEAVEYEVEDMDSEDTDEQQMKRACLESLADAVTSSSSQGNNTITDEGMMCTICFESWTSDGPHRPVSLKCGHVFAQSCIEKWLLSVKKCPTCQGMVRKTDIRVLYVRSLKAMDTSVKASLEKKIEEANERLGEVNTKLALANFTSEQKDKEIEKWKQEVERLKRCLIQMEEQNVALRTHGNKLANISNIASHHSNSGNSNNSISSSRAEMSRKSFGASASTGFKLTKNVPVCNSGGCRVMASCQDMETIAISLPNPETHRTGFGVKRCNTHNFALTDFIPIHGDTIFDMSFKPNDPLLLSASADKTMKLTSLIDKSVVSTFILPFAARSCCWHPSNVFKCFVGLGNGSIFAYDIRQPSNPTHEFDGLASNALVSVQFVNRGSDMNNSQTQSFSGLLCNSLTTCFFYEISDVGDIKSKQILPLEGKFLPAHYDQKSGYGLISMRPSEKQKQKCLQHHVVQLNKVQGSGIVPDIVQTFPGGSKSDCLSKSKLFTNPSSFNQKPYVFAADEQNCGIMLYDVTGRKVIQVIKNTTSPSNNIMDIGLVSSSADRMQIAALTEKDITFYDKTFAY